MSFHFFLLLQFCISALQCPEGTNYDPCGTPCPATCGGQMIQTNCSDSACIETCVCPDGQVLDGDRCVDPSQCGCTLENGLYLPVSHFIYLQYSAKSQAYLISANVSNLRNAIRGRLRNNQE